MEISFSILSNNQQREKKKQSPRYVLFFFFFFNLNGSLTQSLWMQAGQIFHDWAQLPISREEFLRKQAPLQEKYFQKCRPLPGVRELLEGLAGARTSMGVRTGTLAGMGMGREKEKEDEEEEQQQPQVHLALATSSHRGNFSLKTAHMADLFEVFAPERRLLGDDPRIPKGRGKPAPDIYLQALKTINEGIAKKRMEAGRTGVMGGGEGVRGSERGSRHYPDHHLRPVLPEECLVFEDSVPGVEAGRRAGMQVVWCPHPGLLREYEGKEELVLAGMAGLGKTHHEEEGESKDREQKKVDLQEYLHCEELDMFFSDEELSKLKAARLGQPGQLGDGWARLLGSLENFPYEHYGMRP